MDSRKLTTLPDVADANVRWYHGIMVRVIALLAQKGGSGKTTLAVHLAVAAAGKNKHVVIADLDPQGDGC